MYSTINNELSEETLMIERNLQANLSFRIGQKVLTEMQDTATF